MQTFWAKYKYSVILSAIGMAVLEYFYDRCQPILHPAFIIAGGLVLWLVAKKNGQDAVDKLK